MRVSLTSLRWLAAETGVKIGSRTYEILRMRYVDGAPFREIARTLEVRDLTARKVCSRWKHKVHLQEQEWARRAVEADEEESAQQATSRHAQADHALYAMDQVEAEREEDGNGLSAREQAKVILASVTGPAPAKPATPTYDDQGRKVGGGSKAVTVDELENYIASADRERAQASGWKLVGPPLKERPAGVRGMGGDKPKPPHAETGVTCRLRSDFLPF